MEDKKIKCIDIGKIIKIVDVPKPRKRCLSSFPIKKECGVVKENKK